MFNKLTKLTSVFKKISKTKLYILIVIIFIITLIGFLLAGLGKKEISIEGKGDIEFPDDRPVSSLRGEPCNNASVRPIAVMFASDPIARPLSGISQADIVVEMPVTPSGITRTMALFQCNQPSEIGSIRSARNDFLPLVSSFDAIYAHWGGERSALEKLDKGILNNIDALKYENTYFYRKRGARAPHDGFTSYKRLKDASEKFSYSLQDLFEGYPRKSGEDKKNISQLSTKIEINYDDPYSVLWQYDSRSNSYKRFRNGSLEIDGLSDNNIEVKNVITIKTTSSILSIDYIEVEVLGTGEARIYKNGIVKNARWEKSNFLSKLYFYDNEGDEIRLEPGPTWIHYITK